MSISCFIQASKEMQGCAGVLTANQQATLYLEDSTMSAGELVEGMSEMSAKFREEGGRVVCGR